MKLLVVALLLQDPIELKYGGEKGASAPVDAAYTLTLKITGTEQMVTMVRSAEAFFGFEKIRVRASGERKILSNTKGKVHVKIEVDEARVDGVYDDEKYEFDFEKSAPPEGLDKDKLQQICWFLGMGGRDYTLGLKGDYKSSDENQDAWGEILDYASVAAVRLPDAPVKVGEEWESKWKTERKQKDNDGRYAIAQKAKIEKIEKNVARISFSAKASLEIPKEKVDKNQKKSENVFEASGWVDLDLKTGAALGSESKGKVRAWATFHNEEGGADHELEILSTVEAKITPK